LFVSSADLPFHFDKEKLMRRLRFLSIIIVTFVLATFGGFRASAQDATPTGEATPSATAGVVAPGTTTMGMTDVQWATAWWQWSLSFPTAINPGADNTGAACGLGQHGPVFFLATSTFANAGLTRTCSVPEGMAILAPVIGTDCSTSEAAPYNGTDAESLASCAKGLTDAITDAKLTIDGTDVADIASYRVQTPVFNVILPDGNWLNAPAGPDSVVADGAFIVIEPLSVGAHTVTFGGTYTSGSSILVTYNIEVVAGTVAAS